MDSAGSIKPASVEYQFGGNRFDRPRRTRLPSWETTATMMVGSVRGKERLEIVVRVLHDGRSADVPSAVRAASLGGQVRLVPAFTDNVGLPQVPQKVFLLFQSIKARACA